MIIRKNETLKDFCFWVGVLVDHLSAYKSLNGVLWDISWRDFGFVDVLAGVPGL